jgi:hypothetical protein
VTFPQGLGKDIVADLAANPAITTNSQMFCRWRTLCPFTGHTMIRRYPLTLSTVIVSCVLAAIVRAESLADYPEYRQPAVRTTNVRLAGLIRDGVRFSPTFQTLAERLSNSDLIVFVDVDSFGPEGLDGRLTFVASAPGARYVRIRVTFYPDAARQIAIIGHELQHAVEIADDPAIVDEESLGREYARIGYPQGAFLPRRQTFDTEAAIKTGQRVYRELTTGGS